MRQEVEINFLNRMNPRWSMKQEVEINLLNRMNPRWSMRQEVEEESLIPDLKRNNCLTLSFFDFSSQYVALIGSPRW